MSLIAPTLKARISKRNLTLLVVLLVVSLPMYIFAGEGEDHGLIQAIGISIIVATLLAYIGNIFKQPLLLAYILAGVLIGPKMGLGLVQSDADIKVISEIGLILLLFMIGLEIDMKKLKESGSSLILSGILQFVLCVSLGFIFFFLYDFTMGGGKYDLAYLAVCCAISSTTIVVKLLYEKNELDTLPGRLTLGILVFQDLWAIVVLGVQPNLANPDVLAIVWSFAKGGVLVAVSLLVSRYVLSAVFKSIAMLPELVLVASLGWCFLVCAAADALDLSLEMGALIAGAAISTFPYNLDVIAKIVSIRDFFLTLFFVALGMTIPNPMQDLGVLKIAAVTSLFVILSRFASIFPILYSLKNGNRVSLLVPINLSQISEFALVIAAIGFANGHIGQNILSIVIFAFAITSVLSTYMIKFSHSIQNYLNRSIQKIGIRDISSVAQGDIHGKSKEIALLGFFRVASSFIKELESQDRELKEKIVVVDFNPHVHQKLKAMGVKVIYGDISNMETLHHAGIHDVKMVISTIPDTILKGTDNLKLIRQISKICPHAKIIVTAESVSRALKMYTEGADYVLLPRILSSRHLIDVIKLVNSEDGTEAKQKEMELLKARQEIIS